MNLISVRLQAIAFACLPALAVALWYGWHRVQRGRTLVDGHSSRSAPGG